MSHTIDWSNRRRQMKQNKLTFQSENLVVDYISFNIQGLVDRKKLERISKYLFQNFGFNSILAKGSDRKIKSLIFSEKNKFQVSFRQYQYSPELKSFWEGTQVIFTGKNANHFYKQIKNSKWDWNIFDLTKTNLGRIDLHYFREFKVTDQNDLVEKFMEKCCQRIHTKPKRRKANWNLESNSLVLRIGNTLISVKIISICIVINKNMYKNVSFSYYKKPSYPIP